MIWGAFKFALKDLLGYWMAALPRIIITALITGVIWGGIVGLVYFALLKMNIIPLDWQYLTLILAIVIATIPVSLSVTLTAIKTALARARHQRLSLWTRPIIVPSIMLFLTTFILSIIVLPAYALLIFPGIYLTFRFMFTIYCIIDHNDGPFKALKCSWRTTKDAHRDISKISWILFALFAIAIIVWWFMGTGNMPAMVNLPTMPEVPTEIPTVSVWAVINGVIKLIVASLSYLFIARLYSEMAPRHPHA